MTLIPYEQLSSTTVQLNTLARENSSAWTECLTFALRLDEDMLFERSVSGVGEGLGGQLRENLHQVASLLSRTLGSQTRQESFHAGLGAHQVPVPSLLRDAVNTNPLW